MTEREKFEQFALMQCFLEYDDLKKYPDGGYVDDNVQSMWVGFRGGIDASTHKAIYEDEVCSE